MNTPTDRLWLRALPVLLLLALLVLPALADGTDYAVSRQPGESTGTRVMEASVLTFVDGDTTHFSVPEEEFPGGVLKGRYLAIDTPECTGKVEPFGQAASDFTREKLSSAVSILLESDTAEWELDSTGQRTLVWVWYRPSEGEPYRNLNIELLQNGLAAGSGVARNRYGQTCAKALEQAKQEKRNLYSGQPDPDFYYGDAIELTIRELREHPEEYAGKKVAFTGSLILNDGGSVYAEAFDPETGRYYGMSVYYGYNLSGGGLNALHVGNETRIVGTFQYYEAGGIWQVSDVKYRMMKPDDPDNLRKLGEGKKPAYQRLTAVELKQEGPLLTAASAALQGLTVESAETVTKEDGKISLRLECRQEEETVWIQTLPLTGSMEALLPAEQYLHHQIDVQGMVKCGEEGVSLLVFQPEGILLHP